MKQRNQRPVHRSWWLAFLDETNLVVTGLSAAFLLYTRSAGVLYFTLGALLCSATVKLIKRAIRQPRPVVEHAVGKRKVSYGMPSTHSATIIYYATYIPLACAKLPIHPSLPVNTVLTRVLPVLIAVPYGYVIAASRVWLGHHTWKQVVVGGSYGAALAAVWFELWVRGGNAYGQALERDVNGYTDRCVREYSEYILMERVTYSIHANCRSLLPLASKSAIVTRRFTLDFWGYGDVTKSFTEDNSDPSSLRQLLEQHLEHHCYLLLERVRTNVATIRVL